MEFCQLARVILGLKILSRLQARSEDVALILWLYAHTLVAYHDL